MMTILFLFIFIALLISVVRNYVQTKLIKELKVLSQMQSGHIERQHKNWLELFDEKVELRKRLDAITLKELTVKEKA